jgi:hypothetical protein
LVSCQIFSAIQTVLPLPPSQQNHCLCLGGNIEATLRAYDSKTDAYQVFARMLQCGNPPGDWDALISATKLK